MVVIRMRGLPYDCTETHIREFFAKGANGCEVLENGITFVKRNDGKPTGDAFVIFPDENEVQKALSKHYHIIGNRYIELFKSTRTELERSIKKITRPMNMVHRGRQDCIRLRGLPYEAQVEHIIEFLGNGARFVVSQGVHLIFKSQGNPSGEAFVQMDSEASAAAVAASVHNKYMQIGKKQRYIEVFQCAPGELNLTTLAHIPTQVVCRYVPIFQQPMPASLSSCAPIRLMYWPFPPILSNICRFPSSQPSGIYYPNILQTIPPQDLLSYVQSNPEVISNSMRIMKLNSTPCGDKALAYCHRQSGLAQTQFGQML